MAQTLQQDCGLSSSSDQPRQNNEPPHTQSTVSQDQKAVSQQTTRTSRQLSTQSPNKTSSIASSPQSVQDNCPASFPARPLSFATSHQHQPSKVFISKCNTELQSLLESIKQSYHSDIKELYNDELTADLVIHIGEDFKKPLHRCIIASRAFKLYSALKAFQLIEQPVEEDIIISKFQSKNQDEGQKVDQAEGTHEIERELVLNEELPVSAKEQHKTQEVTVEAPRIFYYSLPDNLISPELLLNFVRRVYLDQDVTEEETNLNQQLVTWIKVNRPELNRVSANYSPDHRESFRTILPDFEELSISKSPIMSSGPQKTPPSPYNHRSGEDTENNIEDIEETSQATSFRDESLTGSLLTRTETFELISKHNTDSSPVVTPSKNILTDPHSDDGDDKNTDVDTSNTPAPYAPTTRTGLKPKTFTTPTGLRTTPRTTSTTGYPGARTNQPPSKAINREDSTKTTKLPGNPAAIKAGLNKQPTSGQNPPTAAKRSSLSSNQSEASPDQQKQQHVSNNKTRTVASSSASKTVKPTLITRAHPISLERSQSPSTNVIKGSTRNFIAANKRLISQIEKKPTTSGQADSTGNYDSETDQLSEVSSFAIEPLTLDNLVANMDKLTLVSHSKLVESLSNMFIDGILPDTIILVREGKQITAHKCILAARSAYLSDLIIKQLPPSLPEGSIANNEATITCESIKIDLSEFSYNAVYFSMLHIYSGIAKIPDDLDLDELTKLTNLLHVTTLRQVCVHNLRMNYCHFFHKPCNVCSVGVLKTLPLAWRYDYTDLYSKCLQWIGTHFASIFCLKEFSELKPQDLVEECYSATLSQLTPDNIVSKTIECQKLLKNLPRVKWTESIICLVGRQLEDFCHYVADNYEKILQSESFLNLGKNCWECEILEENLLAAMNHLKPDLGCKTLIQLHKIECSLETYGDDPRSSNESFASLISKMRKYCERYLLKEAAAVVHCSSWRHMDPSLQKRIKDQAIISTDFDEPTKQLSLKPKLQSMARHQPTGINSSGDSIGGGGTRSPSNRSTPESRLKSPSTTYLPPPKNKTAAARHVKVLK